MKKTKKFIEKVKKFIKKINFNKIIEDRKFSYIMIFMFSLLIMYPSLLGRYHTGDDMYFHMANIAVYAQNLPSSIFAKILPDIGYNLGFGTGIFYPALPHIVGAFIFKFVGLFGKSIYLSHTILNFSIFLLSGITMFWLGSAIFKDNKKALISSLFYITYNYFFVDVIMRGALNESFLFIFIPLVFLGLYNLFVLKNVKKFYIYFIVGYIGLMYSHLVMSVYFTLFLIIFLLFFIKEIFNKNNFKHLCIASLIILIFTSTFTVLMVEHKMFGDYIVFKTRTMSYEAIWNMPFIGFFQPYYYSTGNSGFIYSNLNIIVTLFFILTIIKLISKKVEEKRRKFLLATMVFALLGILLNTFIVIWLHVPSLLLSIQFIWRLSTFVGFGFALVAAESLDWFLNIFKKKYISLGLLVIFILLGYSVYQNNQKLVFDDFKDLKEIISYSEAREYYPTVSYEKYKNYFDNHDDKEIIILNGKADIKLIENNVPYMKFKVSNVSDNVKIELPRVYYLGYTITDSDGNKIKYKQDKYGFISLNINKNDVYTVKYTGTTAYKVACVLKALLIIGIIIYLIYYKRKKGSLVSKTKEIIE